MKQHRELGVGVLKEYNTPTREQRQWLLAAARENGMGIVSHLQSFDGMMTRIVDGYTGGDHPHFPVPFYNDVIELLRQTGFIWTPNLVITGGTVGNLKDMKLFYCDAAVQRQRRGDLGVTETNSICNLNEESAMTTYDAHRISRVAEQVAFAASKGANIGVSAHDKPGSNLHREMWYLWKGRHAYSGHTARSHYG